ncbi:MAG: serine hydrolase domain-containing protein [Pseudomonadota bacterium]|nr:serine hydrolase domain-containing protein [Pseudomonadota bacterium]
MRKRLARFLPPLLVLWCVTFAALASNPAAAAPLPEATTTELARVVAAWREASQVPGVAAAVVVDGVPAWSQGFGLADLEGEVPVRPDTRFRLASVSKPITATAAMKLVGSGRLDLDAPVRTLCPAWPSKRWPVTTRELLGHVGGVRHYRAVGGRADPILDSLRHYPDIESALAVFARSPLLVRPGTAYRYTTFGYTLVGCVIEGASGQDYATWLQEAILGPAGMVDTRADDAIQVIARRARGYALRPDGNVVNANMNDTSYKIPGGGLLSSAADMARFEAALLGGTLLPDATREEMWTSLRLASGRVTRYGLGWNIAYRPATSGAAPVRVVSHSGGQFGTSTAILLAPEQAVGVVVLANLEDVDADALGGTLLDLLLESASQQGPSASVPSQVTP